MSRNGKKPAKTSAKTSEFNGWNGFADIPLTYTQQSEMADAYPHDVHQAWQCLDLLVENGYKVSFGWHSRYRAFTCSATGKGDENPNYGYTVSSYGGDVSKALWATYYKIAVICKWGLWEETQLELPDREMWG